MSEYQYYEFQAVDRPLIEKDMEALRDLSTRAQITPTSFVNVYHWGDFKGDPHILVAKYDEAVKLLVDLRDLNKKTGKETGFNKKLKTICENHRRKSTFLNRLQKKGLRD